MQITSPLKSDRKPHHIGLLRLGAVVRPDGLVGTVTVVSVAPATLTADSNGIGEIRTDMVRAPWYFYGLVREVSVCTNILGQSMFGKKQLAIDILWREQKKEHSVIGLQGTYR